MSIVLSVSESDIKRFHDKYEVCSETGCWVWTGSKHEYGYGTMFLNGSSRRAHRISVAIYHGGLDPDLVVDHLCRNTSCVNPEHLEQVHRNENMARGAHATKTHCKHGHEFTDENTYRNRRGWRSCKACRRRQVKGREKAKHSAPPLPL